MFNHMVYVKLFIFLQKFINIDSMKENINNYEQPKIEIIEIQVEKGFAATNADGGGGGAEGGDVDW